MMYVFAFIMLLVLDNLYWHCLQNRYSVLQEACLGGHLDLVRMLVEEYSCPVDFLFLPPIKQTVGKNLDWLPDVFKGYTRPIGFPHFSFEKMQEEFYRQLGNDTAMKKYLEAVVRFSLAMARRRRGLDHTTT